MATTNDSVWQNVSLPRLALTCLWGTLLLACGFGMTVLEGRYPRGIAMLLFFVFTVLFVRSFKRLMSDRLQAAIEAWIGKTLHFVFRPVAVAASKIAAWLGIGRWRGWGEDEHTFLGRDREHLPRRNKRLKNDRKWGDQQDNRARVRFLYIEYMIKRVRAGYLLRRQLTPHEIAAELALEEDERLLFNTYTEARYAASPDISDETVQTLVKAAARK